MIVLAIDTSSARGGVALVRDGEVTAEKDFEAELAHGKELVPSIKEILEKEHLKVSEIDAIAVCVGPGSYTGLRIGVASAKTLAWSLGCKLVAVSSLEAIATGALPVATRYIVPIIDAQRERFYTALFRVSRGKVIRKTPDSALSAEQTIILAASLATRQVTPAGNIRATSGAAKNSQPPVLAIGDGLRKLKSLLTCPGVIFGGEEYWFVKARTVALLGESLVRKGEFADVKRLEPLYLRLSEAEEKFHVTVRTDSPDQL
jgi:tRNA threonylcarbamoyladenosine biosynthesis protein TsaB